MRALPRRRRALASVSLFADLHPRALYRLSDVSTERIYRRGAVICSRHDQIEGYWILTKGEWCVTRAAPGGPNVLQFGAGCLAARTALPRHGWHIVAAAHDTHVLRVSARDLLRISARYPRLGDRLVAAAHTFETVFGVRVA